MRAARAAIVAVFLAILALPALQMATGAVPVRPLDENRRPAPFPTWAGDPSDAVAKLAAWFDDHYGFRAWLIRAKAQWDYSLFGTSERIHIGRDGWLFYRSVIDQEEPNVERLTDADLDRAVANFAALRDRLAARGIRLLVQTQQLKDKFYGEFLPRGARFARSRHRFDEFRARLAALDGITYLDTTPVLERLKAERPIFHKTDFHWNDPAAYVCAADLTNAIARLAGDPVPFWHVPLTIVHRRLSGGQAMFMPLFAPPTEDALFVAPSGDDSLYTRSEPPPFVWSALRTRDTDVPLLPPTVILGDSFTDGMVRAGLLSQFRRLSYAKVTSTRLADLLPALPPDTKFLVVEFIEVSLPFFLELDLDHPTRPTAASR